MKSHRLKVTENPCARSGETCDRTGVDEPSRAVLYVVNALTAGDVRMAAADEVPLTRARHCVTVFGVVNNEDPSSVQV